MAQIDASIPLQVDPTKGQMPANQMLAMIQAAQKMKQQQAIRNIFAQPGAFQNGALNPQALQQIYQADPEYGAQVDQAQELKQLRQSEVQDAQQTRQEKIIESVSQAAQAADAQYQDILKTGASPDEAKRRMQPIWDSTLKSLSGVLPPEAVAKYKAFDPQVLEQAVTWKDRVAAEKQKREDAQLAEREQHDRAMESVALGGLGVRQRAEKVKEDAANNPDGMLDAQTLKAMGEQYIAGDRTVMQNLGRGAQGGKNLIALRGEIAKQMAEAGIGGKEMAARMAEFEGLKAGERTGAARQANVEMAINEAIPFADLALEASKKFDRGSFTPFNRAEQAIASGTSDPKLASFVAANNSFINAYARAVSPSGVPTVSDKDHAREMLNTAMGPEAYQAVIDQLKKEMEAARESPKVMRQELRETVTGKPAADQTSTTDAKPPAAKPATPKVGDVIKGWRYKGGDPADKNNWEKVS